MGEILARRDASCSSLYLGARGFPEASKGRVEIDPHMFGYLNMGRGNLGKWSGHPAVQRLFSHVPTGEFLQYLLVGVWNTIFGYGTFVLFAYLFSLRWPQNGYIIGGLLSSLINISAAFLAYKKFVFKTEGHYWQEWMRCMAVYGSSIAIGSIILPSLVFVIRHATTIDQRAPYLAAAIMTVFNAIYNFLGNKHFSFRVGSGRQT